MRTSVVSASCAIAICVGLFAAGPSAAQNRLKTCNDEWNAMKANNTVGDKKYADFRKECLARTAAAPAAGDTTAPPPVAPSSAPKATARARTPAPAPAPSETGEPVFPTAVSPKYSSESPGRARMHTCRDQYNENKASKANGGLIWIEKGGGYYSECNKHLKS